ncbi:MAG: YggS family pyridoxal phosphate-dependent enzyme [Chlorobi bacterium]|nr:YggS family pyridoxal phosphate-dependent enzyme [Chlorobiota bacterium]
MQGIVKKITSLQQEVAAIATRVSRDPATITIVAVGKGQPLEHVAVAVTAGIPDIGENYVQELRTKYQALRELPIRWHFIGRLQTNKVKYLVPIVHLFHSLDRESLVHELDRQGGRYGRMLDVLLQVNTSGEPTKAGVLPHNAHQLLSAVLTTKYLRPRGLMTLAGLEHSADQVREEFRLLRTLRDELARDFGLENFTELSMGMSSDYTIAIEEGATIVRIGTRIFGERPTNQPTSSQ